ncbi:MAG: DUF192 domain-containing protein [Acidimicrobiaceae bacterium]|nr:DUF192 domain-containing protein [Acidimicrobiaceae bacterium]
MTVETAQLICDGQPVASLMIATSWQERSMGLLGRNSFEGALLLKPARSIHTFGMRFPIDAAHCDANLCVLRVSTLRPTRISRFVAGTRSFIEARAGMFQLWQLQQGSQLTIKYQ